MKFQFYTFGVPEGFDLFPVETEKIQYFQRYYDGSSENEKLSVLRVGNTISYSYLRYNHISGGGREGSFFGMSLVFENHYCYDFLKIYKLFSELYAAILQQDILLKQTSGGQVTFGVTALKNAANVIDSVKSNIQAIIDNQFKDDFKPLDGSFKQGVNLDKVMELSDEAGNSVFEKALMEFPMISISPEFNGGITKRLTNAQIDKLKVDRESTEREINQLKGEIKVVTSSFTALSIAWSEEEKKKQILQIIPQYNSVANKIVILLDKCNEVQQTVKEYQEIESKLQFLSETSQIIALLKTDLENENKALLPFKIGIQQVDNGRGDATNDEITQGNSKGNDEKRNRNKVDKGNTSGVKNKYKKLIYWVVSIAIVVVLLILTYPKGDKYPDTPKYLELISIGNSLIQKTPLKLKNVDDAIKLYEEAQALKVENNEAKVKIVKAKQKAIDLLTKKAGDEFNNGGTGNTKKIDGYYKSLELLTSAKNIYDYDHAEDIIESYKQKTIDYYFTEIDKSNNRVLKKKEYANIVLDLDPENNKAKLIINAVEILPKAINPEPNDKIVNTINKSDCTIHKKFDSTSLNADWNVPDLLIEAKLKLDAGSYEIVIDMCDAVINLNSACVTADQSKKAKSYKSQAEALK